MKMRVKVYISGRVQGVGYRYFVKRQAKKLDLKGWVRNMDDGRVEGVFEGEKDKVEEMIKWCKEGLMLAEVKEVEVQKEDCQKEKDFVILK